MTKRSICRCIFTAITKESGVIFTIPMISGLIMISDAIFVICFIIFYLVPRTGLEPAREPPLTPQASVSTNSTTSASDCNSSKYLHIFSLILITSSSTFYFFWYYLTHDIRNYVWNLWSQRHCWTNFTIKHVSHLCCVCTLLENDPKTII